MRISIDHGFGLIKTLNTSFVTGVAEFAHEPPIMKMVVKYEGKYYALGGKRQNVKQNKTEDNSYYIMTLGAIAEELKLKGLTQANILLCAGLPLTRIGAEKDAFKKYLLQNNEVSFEYEKQHYNVKIKDVELYPQGYSAVIERIGSASMLLVDIGSWTCDILPISNGRSNQDDCASLNYGVIKCMNKVNEELRRTIGNEVDEDLLASFMQGNTNVLPKNYAEVAEEVIRQYAGAILSKLREMGFNLDVMPVTFVGGGASVIKYFSDYNADRTVIVEDIHANARGYELISKLKEAR